MKIIHTADFHANASIEKYSKSVKQIKSYLGGNDIDLIVFGGDLFDHRTFVSEESNYILNSFAELSEYVPVFTTYGTSSHDVRGCLDLLPSLQRRYPIFLIDKINDVMVHFDDNTFDFKKDCDKGIYLFGVPWLMRSRVLNDEELKLPIKEQEIIFKEKFNQWIKFHEEFKKNSKIPVIGVGHLQLKDAVYSKGQDISSEYHDPEWFKNTCDIFCAGHIHKAQNFGNIYYSGSIYNRTWNEMEEKFFNVITIEGNKIVEVEQIKLDTPLLVKADLNSIEEYEKFVKDWERDEFEVKDNKVELWINLTVKSKETFNQENALTFWKKFRNLEDIRLDVSEMKIESGSRVDIKPDATILEKAISWAESKGIELTEFQKQRIIKLEEEN